MDLVFALAERWTDAGEPAGIGGEVEFRTDVFDAESIEALIERLRGVVAAMTADPTRRLSSMDVLGAGELARLDGWGNRAVLTQPMHRVGVDPGVVCRAGGRARRRRWRSAAGSGHGRIASWMRRLTGWRTCFLDAVRAQGSVWRC